MFLWLLKKWLNILKELVISDKSPNLLHTDKGLELENNECNSLLKTYKSVERYNQTYNNKIKIVF